MGAVLELGIIGPLEVLIAGAEPATLGGARHRSLLVVLVLHANELVSTELIVEQLWGEDSPPTAQHTVQVGVSRLRRALASTHVSLTTR